MPVQPRTKELCWKVIANLEKEYNTLNDSFHALANDAQAALTQKDLELINKCKSCTRGIGRT